MILFFILILFTQDTKLHVVSKQTHFSSLEQKDQFSLELWGKSFEDAYVFFTIKTHEGQIIHEENFPSRNLFDYGFDADKKKVDYGEKFKSYILNRMNSFFDEDNFSSPAIDKDGTFDPDENINEEHYNEIKRDQTTVGFFYKIAEEDMRWIAYIKRLKKTVIYFGCC